MYLYRAISNLGFLQFSQKLCMLQRLTIPHLKALIMDKKILEAKGRGITRGLPRPLFVKSVLFRK